MRVDDVVPDLEVDVLGDDDLEVFQELRFGCGNDVLLEGLLRAR